MERALGGGENARNGRQLHKCHKLPAKISWYTQQWPGAGDRGSFERRTCWTRLTGLGRQDALDSCCGVQFLSSACAAQPLYHVLLQLYGERRVRTQREVGPIEQSWRGRARAGGRKENTEGDGLLAVQMKCSFPSVTSELSDVVI